MRSIYAITEDVAALESLLENEETEQDEAAIALFLGELQEEFATKLESVARYRANQAALAEAVQCEADALEIRNTKIRHRMERLDNVVLEAMRRLDIKKIETTVATFRRQANGGKQAIEILDEAALPPEYFRTKTETFVDKKQLADTLLSGAEIPGARLKPKTEGLRVSK